MGCLLEEASKLNFTQSSGGVYQTQDVYLRVGVYKLHHLNLVLTNDTSTNVSIPKVIVPSENGR